MSDESGRDDGRATDRGVVRDVEHNTGRCVRTQPLQEHRLCCERYAECGFKLSMDVLNDAYSGYCFTELTWKCPRCSWTNTIRYKPARKTRLSDGVNRPHDPPKLPDRDTSSSGTNPALAKNWESSSSSNINRVSGDV